MADDTAQISVQIDVASNAEPANRLSDALNQVKNSAGEAAPAVDKHSDSTVKMGEAAKGAGHLLRGLEEAGHGSFRGLLAASQGARHLMQALGMGALGPIALFIAGITAGVMALIKVFDDSKEEAKKLAEESDKVYQGMLKWRALHMDDLKREYETVRKAIDSTLKSTEMLYAAQMKLMDARTAAKLAALDIDEQLALGKLNPGDEMGRKKVNKDYSDQRATVQDDANVDKAFTAKRLADQKANTARLQVDALVKQGEDLAQSYEHAKGSRDTLENEDLDLVAKLASPLSKSDRAYAEDRRKKIAAELNLIQEEQLKRIEQGNALADQYDDAVPAAEAAETDVSSATIEYGVARSRRTGATVKSRNEDTAISYEEQQRAAQAARAKQLADLERQKDAAAERESAHKAHRQLADRGEAPEQLAAFHAAVSGARINLSKSTQDLIQTLIKATEDDARQKQQLIEQIRALREKQDNNLTN